MNNRIQQVKEFLQLPGSPLPPRWLIFGGIILMVLTWLPLAMIAKARIATSSKPHIHLVQDMDKQPKYRTQRSSPIFADGRAMRPRIPGTVAVGELHLDDQYYRGYRLEPSAGAQQGAQSSRGGQGVNNPEQGSAGQDGQGESDQAQGDQAQGDQAQGDQAQSGQSRLRQVFFDGYPEQINVDEQFVLRGQERFNIYCAPCHGFDGRGNGTVQQAVDAVKSGAAMRWNWVQPANLLTPTIAQQPNGQLYNTITNGKATMAAYGPQINVEDRWAIVAYVRVLQTAQPGAESAQAEPAQQSSGN